MSWGVPHIDKQAPHRMKWKCSASKWPRPWKNSSQSLSNIIMLPYYSDGLSFKSISMLQDFTHTHVHTLDRKNESQNRGNNRHSRTKGKIDPGQRSATPRETTTENAASDRRKDKDGGQLSPVRTVANIRYWCRWAAKKKKKKSCNRCFSLWLACLHSSTFNKSEK